MVVFSFSTNGLRSSCAPGNMGTHTTDNPNTSFLQKHGFNPYFSEWWHFSDAVDYPVEETFDPSNAGDWIVNCKEYISLRSVPGGEVIHGREHATAWVMKAMADYWLDHGLLGYGDICYHLIPMSNPDGVTISQTKCLDDAQLKIYYSDLDKEYTTAEIQHFASRWKANGNGVDINRNFSAGWDKVTHRMIARWLQR